MPEQLKKPNYLLLAALALVLALTTMFLFRDVLHHVDRAAGGFGVDRLNILALAAVLFMDTLVLGFLAYRFIFPRFRRYQGECLEGDGKLFESLTDELRAPLYAANALYGTNPNQLALLTERRKVAQFQFLIRCVRLLFCLLALFALLWLAQHALTVAMLAVPGAPPSSVPL